MELIVRLVNSILRFKPARLAWFWLRKRIHAHSYVPVRETCSYRSMVWGHGSPLNGQDIPRLIWSYWQGDSSSTVAACVKSWSEQNPGWTINFLRPEDIAQYLPGFPELTSSLPPQKTSNLVRLMLIEKFGGVWLDASTLVTAPLEWLRSAVARSSCEAGLFWNERAGVYRRDPSAPIVENGCICAPPRSPFISQWRQAYQDCISSDDYRGYFARMAQIGELSRNFEAKGDLSYFVCYLAAQQVMQESADYRLLLVNAEDEYYFYYYNTTKSRNRRQFAETLLLCHKDDCDQSRLIKITKGHRELLDQHISHGCFNRDSLLGQHMNSTGSSASRP